MIPMYVKYMGIEAYGLVGFYGMLQGWFQLLDIGLTPAMGRETARFQGGSTTAFSLRQLLRTLEGIFIVIAMLGALAIIVGSNYITNSWLQVQNLSLMEVRDAIVLMAIIVALRLICGLYRSVINGFEKLVWLNVFSSLIASIRFIGIIPFFVYVGSSPKDFFISIVSGIS